MENDFINKQVEKLQQDFSEDQIKKEVWDYVHREYLGTLHLDAMIIFSMGMYGEIIKRLFYKKLSGKLEKISSGQLDLRDYIKEVNDKLKGFE